MLAVALCFGGHRSTSSSKVSLSSSKAWLSSECPPWCTLHFIIKNAAAQMFAAPTALQFRVPGGQKAVNGVHGSLGSTQHNLHLSRIAFALCLGLLFFWLLTSAYRLASDLWPLINMSQHKSAKKNLFIKLRFCYIKTNFFQEAVCKKNISFCSLFFCSFFSREVPSSGGAGGSDMGAERSSENFFLGLFYLSLCSQKNSWLAWPC